MTGRQAHEPAERVPPLVGPEDTLDGASPRVLDFDAVFTAHAPWLCRAIHGFTGDHAVAEEVVQETFAYVWQHRAELRDGPGLKTWLYRKARHLAMHRNRGAWRFVKMLERYLREPTPAPRGPEEQLGDRQHAERIARCVLSIPEVHREVFVLYELQGLSGPEVAAALEIEHATVATRLFRARAAFRAAWAKLEEAP